MLGKKGVEKVAKVEKERKNKTTHQIKRLFDYQRERERERRMLAFAKLILFANQKEN